jgi:hypothetical protein
MIRSGLIFIAILPCLSLTMCATTTQPPKTKPWEELALSEKYYAVYDASFSDRLRIGQTGYK